MQDLRYSTAQRVARLGAVEVGTVNEARFGRPNVYKLSCGARPAKQAVRAAHLFSSESKMCAARIVDGQSPSTTSVSFNGLLAGAVYRLVTHLVRRDSICPLHGSSGRSGEGSAFGIYASLRNNCAFDLPTTSSRFAPSRCH